jgi:hypothetical protein
MKFWCYVTTLVGYGGISYIMTRYGIHGWDIFHLMLSILLIQWAIDFINDIID